MKKENYTAELSRMLQKQGFDLAPFLNGETPVLLHGQPACRVSAGGDVYCRRATLNPPMRRTFVKV